MQAGRLISKTLVGLSVKRKASGFAWPVKFACRQAQLAERKSLLRQ
jgi:hypothetical protein